MSEVLARWNGLPSKEAAEEILPCCESKAWAEKMAAQRPIADETALLAACDLTCKSLAESDWLEAFRSHPRIGETRTQAPTSERSVAWSREEQRSVGTKNDDVKMMMTEANRTYELRFGRRFIICATGKSATEIVDSLRRRLRNDDSTELYEAAEQQRQITHLRLKKWLST
jgi:2-oxo-4-hydroxy-4-carboxy-5-ureidoimidazoline decarboxylase